LRSARGHVHSKRRHDSGQHTQTRQQIALQHKLDELLRALPGADERLIHLEKAPPDVIEGIVSTEGPISNPDPESE
jgi:low affinity Fe/Cu permease